MSWDKDQLWYPLIGFKSWFLVIEFSIYQIPGPNYLLSVLDISSLHIYLTYPFVLSWSMLEAMSLECLVLGSKTEPVEEVIKDNKNGLLVDFFDHKEIARLAIDVLNNPDSYIKLRKAARKTIVDKYDLNSVCMPKQLELIERLLKWL